MSRSLFYTEYTDLIIEDVFLTLLNHESNVVVAKTAKMIAEISRTVSGRQICTSSNVAKTLINVLSRDDIDVLTQTSRALGNICYENGNYRIIKILNIVKPITFT